MLLWLLLETVAKIFLGCNGYKIAIIDIGCGKASQRAILLDEVEVFF